jgi:hypothetical protein
MVIDPSGKASAAAIFNRSGVSGVILSGDRIAAMAQHILRSSSLFGAVVQQQAGSKLDSGNDLGPLRPMVL